MRDLSNYRKDYGKSEESLEDNNLPNNPIKLFIKWFDELNNKKLDHEINAMTLSTVDFHGKPTNRIVLLKKFSEKGFVFFSNYKSNKGIHIKNNPNVCISFFWPDVEQQIIINGIVTKISDEKSDKYFSSRPIDSQIAAIISNQSDTIPSRDFLIKEIECFSKTDEKIERPDNWGGYILEPEKYEFWQGRENRLHDRISYKKENNIWSFVRLSP